MQETSALYNQILAMPNHWFDSLLAIDLIKKSNGEAKTTSLTQSRLFSIKTTQSLFSDGVPQIGCSVAGEIYASFVDPSDEDYVVPPMAKIMPMVRVRSDSTTSGWIPKGTYYIDTREVSHNDDGLPVMKIHGYDAMLKFEQMYPSDTAHDYPLLDVTMLQFMATSVGIEIDQRTLDIMKRNYTFSLPAGYTMREMLGYIASAYGGNFIISDEGKLLLVPLGGLRTETYYLVTEGGDPIVFGNDRILV